MSRLASWALFVVMTAGIGCAHSRPFTPPEDGGPPWLEWTSPHFVVRTDLPEATGQSLVVALERSYGLLADVAFPYASKPEGRTQVLVVRTQEEHDLLGVPGSAGFYRRHLDRTLPTLFFYGEMSERTSEVLMHELTHRFVHYYFPGAPRWVHEGLAQYYSTATIQDGNVLLGREMQQMRFRPGMLWDFQQTPKGLVYWIPTGLVPTATELRATTPLDFVPRQVEAGQRDAEGRRVAIHYGAAWALVHHLKDTPATSARFDAWMLAVGAGQSPEPAWSDAFPATPDAELDAGLRQFLGRKDTIVLRTAYAPPEVTPPVARILRPDEVHLLWAGIRPWTDEAARRQARADIGAALSIAPQSAEARLWLARLSVAEGDGAAAERNLKEALALAPDDERYTLELFRLYGDQLDVSEDGQRDFSRADALVPAMQRLARSASAHNALAWYLAWDRGRVDDALPHATEAIRDFACFECFDTLAFVLAKKGAFARALQLQTIAVNTAPDGFSAPEMLDRWEHYRRAAAQSPGEVKASARP